MFLCSHRCYAKRFIWPSYSSWYVCLFSHVLSFYFHLLSFFSSVWFSDYVFLSVWMVWWQEGYVGVIIKGVSSFNDVGWFLFFYGFLGLKRDCNRFKTTFDEKRIYFPNFHSLPPPLITIWWKFLTCCLAQK